MSRHDKLKLCVTNLAIALTACTSLSANPNSQGTTTSLPTQSTQSTIANPQHAKENTWKTLLGSTTAPNGWSVVPCEGEASMLCVREGNKSVGGVELGIYPLETLPDFQKILVAVGIPSGETNYQSPHRQAQLLTALKAWAADYYVTFANDRRIGYGTQVRFSPKEPETVPFGSLQGLRYGFAGLEQNGGVREEHVGYVAFDGKALYIISTSFDPPSITGTFDTLKNFRRFEPYLSELVAEINFPLSNPPVESRE